MGEPVDVVLKFEQAINSRNPAVVWALLTADCILVDSLGNRVEGADKMRRAWEGYFKMVPDYTISHSDVFGNGETIALFGSAQRHIFQGRQAPQGKLVEDPCSLAGCGEGREDRAMAGLR
jgi:ketosteroid isomerase-like protein